MAAIGPPLGFAILVLLPNQPFHRFLKAIIGWSPSISPGTLLVMIFSAVAGCKASTTTAFLLITAVMYMQSVTFWISAITPKTNKVICITQKKKLEKKPENSTKHKLDLQKVIVAYLRVTPLGYLNQATLLWIYRTQLVLNTSVNAIFKLVGFHQGVLFVMVVICSFCLVYYFETANFIIYLIFVVSFLITVWIIVAEIYFISGVAEVSERFLRVMKASGFRRSELKKGVDSLRQLHLTTAYPFYTIRKSTCLDFFRASNDFTITLLLDLPKS